MTTNNVHAATRLDSQVCSSSVRNALAKSLAWTAGVWRDLERQIESGRRRDELQSVSVEFDYVAQLQGWRSDQLDR